MSTTVATSCAVQWCAGSVRGQMLACAPHWSLLSPALRLELVAAWDVMHTEELAGRPTRGSREAWRALAARAQGEWATLRAELGITSPHGKAWRAAAARARLAAQPASGAGPHDEPDEGAVGYRGGVDAPDQQHEEPT